MTTLKCRLDGGVDEDGILAVELEHPAALPEGPHRLEDLPLTEPEVEDHERLRGRDAGVDHRRQLGDGIVHPAEDRRAQGVVDRGVVRRHDPELVDSGEDRAVRGRRRAGARVVEREERRRPAEGRSHRVLEEAIRLGVGRDPRVGVDVDDAWQDEEPGRIDHFVGGRSQAREVGLDRLDDPAADRDVRPPRSCRRDDGPAADEKVGHSTSRIEMSWAPSHRQRRPISRSRSSQPSSGITLAKWFAASWPTFDAVVQPPYGKKISHSLMPPG